ncbi:hypothetical protein A2U01_0040736, partial [Trifolium medium]|nr:hypothetical protein [Trifolium medium]
MAKLSSPSSTGIWRQRRKMKKSRKGRITARRATGKAMVDSCPSCL